jgi:REP element-mobilizing transposase RayT
MSARGERERVSGNAQLSLPFPRARGGRRKGAGRRPLSVRGAVPHVRRPVHRAREPVHVTLRSRFRPLRSQFVFPTVRRAIADANRRGRGCFRIVHYSVQEDHLHLIVEAAHREALHGGVRGLSGSLARQINRLVFRKGGLFADRWHGRALITPRAVRNALVYVLTNFKKHGRRIAAALDPYSSAPYFDGFREYAGELPVECEPAVVAKALRAQGPPVARAQSWLLRVGWLRHGTLSIHEYPAHSPHGPTNCRSTPRSSTPPTKTTR